MQEGLLTGQEWSLFPVSATGLQMACAFVCFMVVAVLLCFLCVCVFLGGAGGAVQHLGLEQQEKKFFMFSFHDF